MSSDNYLPDMVMPEPAQETSIDDTNTDPLISKADDGEGAIKMEINEETDAFEGDDDIIREEMEDDIMEEETPEPIVKPKRKLNREEVFGTPKIMPVTEPEKPVKKKRQATQKQLDALSKARANMKAKRDEAKKLKEQGKEPPPSKRKQKQVKQVQEVIQQQGNLYSEEQIAKMVEQGIQKYDIQRKARKVIKNKQKEEDAQQLQVQRQVQRAMGQPDANDIWGQALAGLI